MCYRSVSRLARPKTRTDISLYTWQQIDRINRFLIRFLSSFKKMISGPWSCKILSSLTGQLLIAKHLKVTLGMLVPVNMGNGITTVFTTQLFIWFYNYVVNHRLDRKMGRWLTGRYMLPTLLSPESCKPAILRISYRFLGITRVVDPSPIAEPLHFCQPVA